MVLLDCPNETKADRHLMNRRRGPWLF
jgi:hypothetical protein